VPRVNEYGSKGTRLLLKDSWVCPARPGNLRSAALSRAPRIADTPEVSVLPGFRLSRQGERELVEPSTGMFRYGRSAQAPSRSLPIDPEVSRSRRLPSDKSASQNPWYEALPGFSSIGWQNSLI
jgi:hypothetical protein